MDSTIVLL